MTIVSPRMDSFADRVLLIRQQLLDAKQLSLAVVGFGTTKTDLFPRTSEEVKLAGEKIALLADALGLEIDANSEPIVLVDAVGRAYGRNCLVYPAVTGLSEVQRLCDSSEPLDRRRAGELVQSLDRAIDLLRRIAIEPMDVPHHQSARYVEGSPLHSWDQLYPAKADLAKAFSGERMNAFEDLSRPMRKLRDAVTNRYKPWVRLVVQAVRSVGKVQRTTASLDEQIRARMAETSEVLLAEIGPTPSRGTRPVHHIRQVLDVVRAADVTLVVANYVTRATIEAVAVVARERPHISEAFGRALSSSSFEMRSEAARLALATEAHREQHGIDGDDLLGDRPDIDLQRAIDAFTDRLQSLDALAPRRAVEEVGIVLDLAG